MILAYGNFQIPATSEEMTPVNAVSECFWKPLVTYTVRLEIELEQKDMKKVISHMLHPPAVSHNTHSLFSLLFVCAYLRDECNDLVPLGPNLSRSLDCLHAMFGSLVDLVQFLVRVVRQSSSPCGTELLVRAGNIEARVPLD